MCSCRLVTADDAETFAGLQLEVNIAARPELVGFNPAQGISRDRRGQRRNDRRATGKSLYIFPTPAILK